MKSIKFKIYSSIATLPKKWDEVSVKNVFLQTSYLKVLEESAPTDMQCFYIGVFEKSELIGVALAQYINLNELKSFGERDKSLKTFVRNFIFKNFASHVLFIGNNMITGQNGFTFIKEIDVKCICDLLIDCSEEIKSYLEKQGIKIHLISFKDFYQENILEFKKHTFSSFYEFNTQPNMIFNLNKNWNSYEDYIQALSKKYRAQHKRAKNKFSNVIVKELNLEEIISFEDKIYNLYHEVAINASFNTFFLAKNHFSTFKRQCGKKFILCGYFYNENLIGFHSLLLNNSILETYFLGYDKHFQKDKMIYLNMLYNMTKFGINNRYEKIIFGRTALEIKSSIGAIPVEMSGFLFHTNKLINKSLPNVFPRLEPTLEWQQRHPFQ